MSPATRRRVVTVAKLALGLGLLAALLLWRDTAGKVVQLFLNFQVEYLFVLILIAFLLRLVSAIKWSVLLRHRGIRLPLPRLFGLHLIGQFFSNFMPSMIGGDLTKIYLLGRQIRSHAQSAASVFVDRLTGLIALLFLVILFSALNHELIREPIIGFSVALVAAGCTALLILIFSTRIRTALVERLAFIPLFGKVTDQLAKFHDEIVLYGNSTKTLLIAFACSLVFYLLTSLSLYFSCLAIGFRPPFIDVALITPIIFLVTALPVSPNNIGWWEWSVSLLLAGTGAELADGLSVALIMRTVSTAISAIGGLLFLMERTENPAKSPQP